MQLENYQPKIIGHRGAAGSAFENSVEGIKKALELKPDAIEIDVWQTADGEIVVFHDAFLERLTDHAGFIAETNTTAMKKIRLKNGESIPALIVIIALVKPSNIPFLVEVKAENAYTRTLEILETAFSYAEFVIGSFFHQPMMELKMQKPQLRTAIMLECVPADLAQYLQKVNPEFVVAAIETHNALLTETVEAQNRKLLFYTV